MRLMSNWWLRRKHRKKARSAVRTYKPWAELLEERAPPATYTVLNTSDSGPGSLRQAILDANADTDPTSTIRFNIGGGAVTIMPSALPTTTHSTLLDGWTQPGWSG